MAMFGKEPAPRTEGRLTSGSATAMSIIADGVKIVGDIESSGILKVDGSIHGAVRGARQVLLGHTGIIRGDISTAEAVIAGTVYGSIAASIRIELQAGAMVNGDIATESIIVLEGARINGTVRMGGVGQGTGSPLESQENLVGRSGDPGSLRLAN
jgi:cytoskeletal protein CcmA (bactofilin family)